MHARSDEQDDVGDGHGPVGPLGRPLLLWQILANDIGVPFARATVGAIVLTIQPGAPEPGQMVALSEPALRTREELDRRQRRLAPLASSPRLKPGDSLHGPDSKGTFGLWERG